MSDKNKYAPKPTSNLKGEPFENALEAWFWFILAQQARIDGARFTSGMGATPRPCEPTDILNVLNRLYRDRRLEMDHLMVLRHYGRRQMPPDPRRAKEVRAHQLWSEALKRLEAALVRKGIVRAKKLTATQPNKFWVHGAIVYETTHHEGAPYGR